MNGILVLGTTTSLPAKISLQHLSLAPCSTFYHCSLFVFKCVCILIPVTLLNFFHARIFVHNDFKVFTIWEQLVRVHHSMFYSTNYQIVVLNIKFIRWHWLIHTSQRSQDARKEKKNAEKSNFIVLNSNKWYLWYLFDILNLRSISSLVEGDKRSPWIFNANRTSLR